MTPRALRLLVLLVLAAGAGGLWLARAVQLELEYLEAPMGIAAGTEYTVPPGASFAVVAQDMARRGWVRSPRVFAWHARRTGKARAVKAGTYALQPGMSALAALDLFVSGREVQVPFTIVEGWSFTQLREALARAPRLEHTLQGLDSAAIMERLGQPGRHPEGLFLAETYHFPPGTSDLTALRRALTALEQALDQAWRDRAPDLPLASPYEVLILASIIEKETAVPDERALIAGVFVERLRRGMLLQTDPTVIYGLGDGFDGNLRRRDLENDTPYNTYTRKGLPPTPIALVGRSALEAAVAPRVDGSLYFVSRGDGTHHFSRTYGEHLKAVQRYQLGGADRAGHASGG